MQKLTVFNHVSLDGYFVDAGGGLSWAHAGMLDPELECLRRRKRNGRWDARVRPCHLRSYGQLLADSDGEAE